jgi:hypothetical protein
VAAGGRGGQEVGEVRLQPAAHRGQWHGALPQCVLQPVHRHRHQAVPRSQGRRLRRDPVPERAGQRGQHHVGGRERDLAVRGEAVMGDALMPGPGIGVRQPQGRHRAPVESRGRVHGLAGCDAGEPPAGPGAQVARPLRHDRRVRAQHVPRGEQAGVHGHRFQFPAERLTRRHRPRQPPGLAQAGDRAGEPGRQRPAVRHHVRHRERGRSRFPEEPRQHGRERRMQVGHHHRHAVD